MFVSTVRQVNNDNNITVRDQTTGCNKIKVGAMALTPDAAGLGSKLASLWARLMS